MPIVSFDQVNAQQPAASGVLSELKGAVLVLPTISVGNCAQLAIDLLLNTLPCRLVARLEHEFLEPCVSHRALDKQELSTELELYQIGDAPGDAPSSSRGLFVLQQRTPVARGHAVAFAKDLAAWARSQGVGRALVLSSLDARVRRDQHMADPGPRLIALNSELRALVPPSASVRPLEDLEPSTSGPGAAASDIFDRPIEERRAAPWPLLVSLAAAGVPSVALAGFTTEGDNAGDGEVLAGTAAGVLGAWGCQGLEGLRPEAVAAGAGEGQAQRAAARWRRPLSWASLYGPARDEMWYF